MFIFLDESGDLGFDINKQCSHHFTITLLICDNKNIQGKIKKAVKRTLKNKINHKAKRRLVEELKGTGISLEVKKYFLDKMPEQGWSIFSITVAKAKVSQELSTASGKKKLYNHLAKKIIKELPYRSDINSINLVVDKCKNKSERADFDKYIKSQLQMQFGLDTNISINHESSKESCCLQAVDLFCWGLQRQAEMQDEAWSNCFQEKVKVNLRYSD